LSFTKTVVLEALKCVLIVHSQDLSDKLGQFNSLMQVIDPNCLKG